MSLPFITETTTIQLRYYQQEAADALWSAMGKESPCAVLPTGSGKSLVIAELCRRTRAAGGRVIVLQPSKELIQQNADECRALMPGVDVGLYSAGLKSRHTDHDIVFAGIQSCFDKAHQFGSREVVLCDEVHLLPPEGEGRYRTFLRDLKAICPHVRLAGLTATAFRTGTGALCGPENMLTRVAYTASVSRLMTEGYLCPVVNRPTVAAFDTSGLKINGRTHEFETQQADALFADEDDLIEALTEAIASVRDRHSILVFCSGVKNATRVSELLATMTGDRVGLVIGDTMPIERLNTFTDFKANRLRWLVGCETFTTGFNAKCADAAIILRATASPGLFAQICGRLFRPHESKQNGLVMDYGGNVARHGPIDSDDYGIPKEKAKREGGGGMPEKECPACGADNVIAAKACIECGFQWPAKPRHEANADTESAILQSQIEPTEYLVESASFHRHTKRDDPHAPNTLRVDYVCQLADGGGDMTRKTVSEWVCLNHEGFAKRKAMTWWRERSKAVLFDVEGHDFIDEAIELWKRGAIAIANRIWVVPKGRFSTITKQELDDVPDEWDTSEAVEVTDNSGFDYAAMQFGEAVPF